MANEKQMFFRWHVLDYWSWIFRTATAAGIGAAVYTASDFDTSVKFLRISALSGIIGMGLMYWMEKL